MAGDHGAGNAYRHDCDNVTEDQVWRTVSESLVDLIVVIEQELGDRT
jgi:hypothetical protein